MVITDLRNDSTLPEITGNNMYELYRQKQADVDADMTIGYTVNPATREVDFIYVVDSGWQREAIYTLSDELYAAGWRWIDTTDSSLNVLDSQYITLYNESSDMNGWKITNLNHDLGLVDGAVYTASSGNGLTVSWSDNAGNEDSSNVDATVVDNGYTLQIGNVTEIPELSDTNRTVEVEISGLKMNVQFTSGVAGNPAHNAYNVYSSLGAGRNPSGTITLGDTVRVIVESISGFANQNVVSVLFDCDTSATYDVSYHNEPVGNTLAFDVTPRCWGTYLLWSVTQ